MIPLKIQGKQEYVGSRWEFVELVRIYMGEDAYKYISEMATLLDGPEPDSCTVASIPVVQMEE